jgi:hypothetical protein
MAEIHKVANLAFKAGITASALVACSPVAAAADQDAKIADLQRQVDELKAIVRALQAAQAPVPIAQQPLASPASGEVLLASKAPSPPASAPAGNLSTAPAEARAAPKKKAWYEKLMIRGYTQLRINEVVSGPKSAPNGVSRLRSVQDSGINENGNFSLRRVRVVLQGDISDRISLYLQGDMAAAVSNQSGTESRQNFFQMRDAYADVFLDKAKTLKVRFGQSKVPYGWENLQSSSNRVPLDRTDAINAPVPGERDLGVVLYYTPPGIQKIWDELSHDGQKLFGNYGAFAVAAYNGQGVNRTERTGGLMTVAMATVPLRLDGIGLEGQVAEFGVSAMRNQFRPEIRSGSVSSESYDDNHVNFHGMIYPKPIGIQAEWTFGTAPQWDRTLGTIRSQRATGGYVMAMYRVPETPVGQIIPFARWQKYRGGWKAATNAPRLESEEYEAGVEWLPLKELEITMSYSRMMKSEADERRLGIAKGDVLRAQVQWNY